VVLLPISALGSTTSDMIARTSTAPCRDTTAPKHHQLTVGPKCGSVVARIGSSKQGSVASPAYSKDVTGLSSLRFSKPEDGEMAQLMSEWNR
jgi:hypothetical protein